MFFGSLILFTGIGLLALRKNKESAVSLKTQPSINQDVIFVEPVKTSLKSTPLPSETDFPLIDRMHQLFSTGSSKLPIVETVEYLSTVPWLKGRPAWLADYAVHYNTSKHFISRSLSGSDNYFIQTLSQGSRFNVFCKDKKIEFHLVVDMTRLKLAFYYLDLDTHERVLLKVYRVGLGRMDSKSASGYLTPFGCYQLGEKVSIYKPGVMGLFHEQKAEMIRVFGSRWIPFDSEIAGCTEAAKGYGIHGAPWVVDSKTGSLVENRECIGKYESDGCIRLLLEDIEEIYAIVITKPTFIHIVKNFHAAVLPGVEVGTPSR